MPKCKLSVAMVFITTAFATVTAFAAGFTAPEDPLFSVISTTPLAIQSVNAKTVCGTAKSGERVCLGERPATALTNVTVSKLKYFVIGEAQLCGVDERGVQCWNSKGLFEKPVSELLAMGEPKLAQIFDEKVCVPHADRTVHCHRPEAITWVESVKGSGTRDQMVKGIPAVEIFGPYNNLRDFDAGDNMFCAIDGDELKCQPYRDSDNGLTPVSRTYKGAKAVSSTWNTTCVLSDDGLDCARGYKANEMVTYHVEGTWKKAVKLFRRGYSSVCGADDVDQPMCVYFEDEKDKYRDVTPPDLLKPDVQVLKFKSSAEQACAFVESKSTHEKSLMCGGLSSMTKVEGVTDVADFALSPYGTCTVNSKGVVDCFAGEYRRETPLQEDGSKVQSAGRCHWNDSGFNCSSTAFKTDFSDVAKVIAASTVEDDDLPCILFDNRSGARSVRCFGGAENLSVAPALSNTDSRITASYRYACAYGGPNTTCWGEALGVEPPNLSNVKKMGFGDNFGCARDEFGFVCWGKNIESRQLAVPQGLGDLDSVRDFGVGTNHVCVINRDSQVLCWGLNPQGQTEVPPLTNPTSIVVNGNTNCASSDEGVTCWGYRQNELLGKGAK